MLPGIPVVVICPPGGQLYPDADFRVDSFQPAKLLETLRGLEAEGVGRDYQAGMKTWHAKRRQRRKPSTALAWSKTWELLGRCGSGRRAKLASSLSRLLVRLLDLGILDLTNLECSPAALCDSSAEETGDERLGQQASDGTPECHRAPDRCRSAVDLKDHGLDLLPRDHILSDRLDPRRCRRLPPSADQE